MIKILIIDFVTVLDFNSDEFTYSFIRKSDSTLVDTPLSKEMLKFFEDLLRMQILHDDFYVVFHWNDHEINTRAAVTIEDKNFIALMDDFIWYSNTTVEQIIQGMRNESDNEQELLVKNITSTYGNHIEHVPYIKSQIIHNFSSAIENSISDIVNALLEATS